MTLDDIVILFGQLQHLAQTLEAKGEKYAEKIEELDDVNHFAFNIKADELKSYLNRTTNFNDSQIDHFLKLVEYSDEKKRIDLWNKPLIKLNEYYLIPLVPISCPNILYLIDEWLDVGGYDLKERGALFEKYIKNSIKKAMPKEYIFSIPEKNKFYSNVNCYEEIDLIVILKEIVLVAEVKCIKYPFGPRDYHNSFERLKNGAEQIARKTEFLKANAELFCEDIGDTIGKKFISVVITNYPTFSGLKIENVPIIDFFLLDGYINSGKMRRTEVKYQKREAIDFINLSEVIYYTNEKEFNYNIENYIIYPPPVEEKLSKLSLVDRRITLEGAKPHIYIKDVIMKTN